MLGAAEPPVTDGVVRWMDAHADLASGNTAVPMERAWKHVRDPSATAGLTHGAEALQSAQFALLNLD